MTCCNRPAIATMDYRWPVFNPADQQVTMVNRCCTHCFAHWFGPEGEVKEYTRKEWDTYINTDSQANAIRDAYDQVTLDDEREGQ